MLISHERLDSLKEQLDYLTKMHTFMVKKNINALNENMKDSVLDKHELDELKSAAVDLAHKAWDKAGLVQSTARIQLEIQFLEDVLID